MEDLNRQKKEPANLKTGQWNLLSEGQKEKDQRKVNRVQV